MEKPPTKKLPKIELSSHSEFRVIHVNSWLGGCSPIETAEEWQATLGLTGWSTTRA